MKFTTGNTVVMSLQLHLLSRIERQKREGNQEEFLQQDINCMKPDPPHQFPDFDSLSPSCLSFSLSCLLTKIDRVEKNNVRDVGTEKRRQNKVQGKKRNKENDQVSHRKLKSITSSTCLVWFVILSSFDRQTLERKLCLILSFIL